MYPKMAWQKCDPARSYPSSILLLQTDLAKKSLEEVRLDLVISGHLQVVTGLEQEDLEGLLVDAGDVLLQLSSRHGSLVDPLLLLACMLNIEQAGKVLELGVHVLVGVDRGHLAVATAGKAG